MDDPDEPFTAELPVCDEDEPDARVMHSVLRAWDISFQDMVLHTPFLQLWFALPEKERRAIIADGNMVYFEELDVTQWRDRMLKRDDVDMCRAVLSLSPPVAPEPEDMWTWARSTLKPYMAMGAIKCLQVLQTSAEWDDDEMLVILDTGDALEVAAFHGQIPMIRELKRRGLPWIFTATKQAVKGGQLATLRFLHENGCDWNYTAIQAALERMHDRMVFLEYALDNGCSGSEIVCGHAAQTDDIALLKYAHERGLSWDEKTCEFAAQVGSYICLEYAHSHGCPWDRWAMHGASAKGSLLCVKYCHENGLPWHISTTHMAASGNNVDVFMYAYLNECPVDVRACYKVTTSIALKRFLARQHPEMKLDV